MEDILFFLEESDGILGYAVNMTADVPMGSTNLFDVRMPRIDLVLNANPGTPGQFFEQIDPAVCEDPPPSHGFNLKQRDIRVHHLRNNLSFCAYDVRDAWDGLLFVDNETIPAEAVVEALWMAAAIADLEMIYWYGRGAIVGLLQQINTDLCNNCIAAAQNPLTVAWDATTAIANTRLLLEAQSSLLRRRNDVDFISYPMLKQFFYDEYLGTNGFVFQNVVRDRVPDWMINSVYWKTDFWKLTQPTPIDAAILTVRENLMYVLQGAADQGQMWYDINTDTIKIRQKLWFGQNYRACELITTDIDKVCAP